MVTMMTLRSSHAHEAFHARSVFSQKTLTFATPALVTTESNSEVKQRLVLLVFWGWW
jgi:hypothetical protein